MALQKQIGFKGNPCDYWVAKSINHNLYGNGIMPGVGSNPVSITYSLFTSKEFYDSLPANERERNEQTTQQVSVSGFGKSLAEIEAGIVSNAVEGNPLFGATVV